MNTEERLLITGLKAMHKALDREPEHPSESGGFARWKGCCVWFDEDGPEDGSAWDITFNDKRGVCRELPQELSEMLIEDYYEEILAEILKDTDEA